MKFRKKSIVLFTHEMKIIIKVAKQLKYWRIKVKKSINKKKTTKYIIFLLFLLN